MKKGVPISPGVAVARAYRVEQMAPAHAPAQLELAALSTEIIRFERACLAAAAELERLSERLSRQVGDDQAAIFQAHKLLVRDPALARKVKTAIQQQQVDAHTALERILEEYATLFASVADPYLQDRLADLHDVVGRIQTHLHADKTRRRPLDVNEPVILVAGELLPSQALGLDREMIAGIATERGGATGHAAILARALGIPAVSGLTDLLNHVQIGDLIALDGREGHLIINPGPEVEHAYRKLQREYVDVRGELVCNHDQPAVTADGAGIDLLANVNNAPDAALAAESGATGVGLYRTEYLFLAHPTPPDEAEQLAVYRQVIESAPNRTVTIRTLDLGGDKALPYLGGQRETNPFMGLRSIRLSSAYPELFQTQLRAILRAGVHGNISLLFPMISTIEEVRRVKQVVARNLQALTKAKIPHAQKVPLGIMIEVPSAALLIEDLLEEVDFVSIGSNDLIQYLMAADRDNPKVAHLCEPFGPAILRLLARVIEAANRANKPVTLCGEMAGLPRCVLALLGMGLRRLSMSPGFVPPVKDLIRHCSRARLEVIAQTVLEMRTVGEVRGYLSGQLKDLWPRASLLDICK
jgi:phosphoenolpyruvate-protein phosphotransferase